jgi:hypothetical protein
VTFVDLSDLQHPRYQHVLLVAPVRRDDGAIDVLPVRIHAGGLAWQGPVLHVAGTARGLFSFHLDDIVAVAPKDSALLGRRSDGGLDTHGYRHVLPLRWRHTGTGGGSTPLRYSFLSVDRATRPHRLLAGEYGGRDASHRLVTYPMDPDTGMLHVDGEARSWPDSLHDAQLRGMQGATRVKGQTFVSTSAGRYRRGDLWVGQPERWRRWPRVLPVGPEALALEAGTGWVWSLSEYPGRRLVFATDPASFLAG